MAGDLKQMSRAEVAEHNSAKSCWIVIDNKVYDVTPFLDEHPGGVEVLLEHAGIDGTEDFEDTGHSTDARAMRDQYLIGEIREEERQTYEGAKSWDSPPDESSSGYANMIIALIIGLVAFIVYRWATDQ